VGDEQSSVNNDDYSHIFNVELDFFRGPVDLLLHLVKQNELPIEKISLAEVATQYLQCIEALRLIDLDIAGEYLVIAATLLSIKSSVLLNEPVELVADEEGNLVDPHDELLKRLREAEIFREGTEFLEHQSCLGVEVFAPPSTLTTLPLENLSEAPLKQHDPMLLGRAFRKLMEKTKKACYRVNVAKVSVVQQMTYVLDKLKLSGGVAQFEKLIPKTGDRLVLLVSFVALLELCKKHAISVSQNDLFSDITIMLCDTEVELQDFNSEFDENRDDNLQTMNA